MTNIYFEVQGVPVPKGRPRMTKTGHTYTPKETKDYEDLVKWSFIQQVGIYENPPEEPVMVKMVFRMPIPKSYSLRKLAKIRSQKMACPKRPDIDNLAKIVLDALNGLAYKDDNQIVQMELSKVYSDKPGTTICINEIV